MHKVSLLVANYNNAHYLPECLQSICNQTYEHLEIIVVDDGSTDNSYDIAMSFAEKDNRIKVYRKNNKGLSDTRNVGLMHATGDYVGFVDSDDYLDVHMVEKMMQYLLETNSDVCICDFQKSNQPVVTKEVVIKTENHERVFKDIMLDKISSHAWNKLYKKTLFDHIQFPLNMHFEDLATMYLVFEKVSKVVFTNERFYHYRIHTNSITGNASFSDFNAKCISQIYREKMAYAKEKQLPYIQSIFKMAVKYNTDYYRVQKRQKNVQVTEIRDFLKAYAQYFSLKINPIQLFFSIIIMKGWY